MNIGIVGSRDYYDYEEVEKGFIKLINILNTSKKDVTIVSGGASGVDTIAENIAKKYGIPTIVHYPKWNEYGKKAAFYRNRYIVNDSDVILAYRKNNSKGTSMTINLARQYNKEVYIKNV